MTDAGTKVAAKVGVERSHEWPEVQKAFLKDHPDCIYCGTGSSQKYGIQVHHVAAFHVIVGIGRPDLELDPRNLCSLCQTEKNKPAPNHHITCGHLGSFQRNNDRVIEDVTIFGNKDHLLIEAMPHWQEEEKAAPKPFSEWSEQEKKDYRAMLDKILPPDPVVMKKYFPNGLPKSQYSV